MELPEVARRPSRKRRLKFLVGGAFIVLSLFTLIGWAMGQRDAQSFYLTVSEALADQPAAAEADVRVNGKVVPGSIDRDGLETTFDMSDGEATMTVVTDRPLPDTFRAQSDVIAKGSFVGGTFTASEVLAKCPSKFKAKA